MAAPEIVFAGFKYDVGKANAMADAIMAVLAQADLTQPTVPDKLAGLGIAAALVIVRSKVQRAPGQVASALATYITDQVAALTRPAGPP